MRAEFDRATVDGRFAYTAASTVAGQTKPAALKAEIAADDPYRDVLFSKRNENGRQLLETAHQCFDFPFILAVKGRTKDEIIASFETRLKHDAEAEFAEALRQIERITLLRLKDRQP